MVLILIILLPVLSSLLLVFLNRSAFVKTLSFLLSLLELFLVVYQVFIFRALEFSGAVFLAHIKWLPQFGIDLNFGLDGISSVMLILSALIFPLIIISGKTEKINNSGRFHSLLHFTQAALMGVFLSTNAIVFYIFWELTLIPVFIQLLVWGGENRQFITLKFFIYTLFGSLSMLFAFLFIYFQTPLPHSFNFDALLHAGLSPQTQSWLFWFMFIGFAIKIPLFPFHSWQPQTYTMAPTQLTIVLSAVLMKMGIFGMLRWLLPLLPSGTMHWSNLVIILSLSGMIYASLIALKQQNLKTLIAWSSMAHGGLMGAAIFALTIHAVQGVLFQSLAHGIIICALFIAVMRIEAQTATLQISSLGGLKTIAPVFSGFLLIFVLGSVGLPLTNGFIGELLMILGLFARNPWLGFFGATSMILGAVYMLYMYQKVCLGKVNPGIENFKDIQKPGILLFAILSLIILLTGLLPGIVLNLSKGAAEELLVNFYSLLN